ncbi:hypothetical protein [Shewanella acanthi]|uniref:hypothetical protein n=1 Tax=Shewanella acanthi TaxID=2864212 RepID=UPI001C65E4BD|nr:hypothetical protein [Shewanella acanthi]MCH1929550.1 hypothetical protein [Shewanella shenzhenensis]QYJ78349.1 hypothetical protein K0H61_14760 [Shewanella acanthi]
MYATILEQHLSERFPNVMLYDSLKVDDKFVFILNRLFQTLSLRAGEGIVEILHIDVCPVTRIPTVELMLPTGLHERDFSSLFDDTQRLLHLAAGLKWQDEVTN